MFTSNIFTCQCLQTEASQLRLMSGSDVSTCRILDGVSTQTWSPGAGAALPVAIEVLRRGPISRAEIARRLGLSHASLSRLCAPLLDRGIIHDVGEHSDGKVGRPSRLLDVDAASHRFLGLKVRESEVIGAITDLRGDVLATRTLEIVDRAPAAVLERIVAIHDELGREHPIAGIGIGIGGSTVGRRIVRLARFLGWEDVPLADLVEAATGAPTLVENDVVALCEYEDWFGFARNDDRFAVVTLGIAMGFGLVVDGHPIVDEDYGLGLVGHWPMDPHGPLCALGHRGCAAALLDADAIVRYAGEAHGRPVGYDEVLALAEAGDPAARRILGDAARGLGILLAAVCNLALPERIVIAGEGVGIARWGAEPMLASLRAHRDARAHTPPIDFAAGDNVEWSRGAAVLAIQAFVRGDTATETA